MTIETLALSLILGLTNIFLAIILGILYRKDKVFKGFTWWIIGIGLLSFHFLTHFVQDYFELGLFIEIILDVFLVSSALALYQGILQFFNEHQAQRNIIFVFIPYIIFSLILFSLGNTAVPKALAFLSVAILSTLSAYIMFRQTSSEINQITQFLAISFLIYAFFFLFRSIITLTPQNILPPSTEIILKNVSYFIVFISSTMWTFGFILLFNVRLLTKTKQTQEIHDLTINTIPDAVLITRLKDGKIIKINEGFTELSGYSLDDVADKSTLDIDIWYDPTQRNKFALLLSETGSVENLEFLFRRKNGKPLNGLVSAKTIDIDDVEHILCIARDITPRKKMEEKLRENEEKYRFLTEYSGEVIWHINKSFRIDYISPADETTRGFRREEVIGQPIWTIFKPEGIKLVREKIEHHRLVEQVGNNMNTTRFEIEQHCKNGEWIWTEITAAPHYDKHATLIGYHGISQDISEKKRLLEQLNRQATIDDLCQIPNRRYFMKLAEKELKRAKRYHHPLSIVVIDFDNLKRINDSYGHLAGDRALIVFSKIAQTLIRDVDIVGRFGGDEFLILLPETDVHQARHVIERIYDVLDKSPVIFKGEQFSIAVSAGITGIDTWTDSLEDLLSRADAALYDAKGDEERQIVIN